MNGESFTSNDQIQVGDDVVIYGQLMLFGSTLEMDANNYIYQHNGEGDGGIEVTKYETLAAAILDNTDVVCCASVLTCYLVASEVLGNTRLDRKTV